VDVVDDSKSVHVHKIKLGDHFRLPLHSDEEQREILTTYVVDGLSRGERVIYYADRTEPGVIGSRLAGSGVKISRVVDEGRLAIRRLRITSRYRPRGLHVAGSIDVLTAGVLTTNLGPATRWPERDIQLDLTELEFIDVAGVRAIVRAASALGPGRRLVVKGLAVGPRKVFEIAGWDMTPGLRFADEEGL